ncbi:MAG: hypothetical protein IPM55_19320 [Acidobacteria bacterium]|nr:hypothetical protein [Acidobacteriota bacterium]
MQTNRESEENCLCQETILRSRHGTRADAGANCGARYGHLMGLHILMLCAAGWSPTADAERCSGCGRASIGRFRHIGGANSTWDLIEEATSAPVASGEGEPEAVVAGLVKPNAGSVG